MIGSRVLAFTDPLPYQDAIRAVQGEVFVTERGEYHAELIQINLPRLWLQRGYESLPRILRAEVSTSRAPIDFLPEASPPMTRNSGQDLSHDDIVFHGVGSTVHRRDSAASHWAAMSLSAEELSATAAVISGHDLSAPPDTTLIRPAGTSMARLRNLHEATVRLAKAAPEMLKISEVARALEQALLHAMITCLSEGRPIAAGGGTRRHATIVARLEQLLAENYDQPLYLAEICAATGVSERTLRACCHEHLGMGPIRYLWLRRMHLVRRALLFADPETTTVTDIATKFGFWELGRFSVEYGKLFGEAPSASLRRPPADLKRPLSPFDLASAEFA